MPAPKVVVVKPPKAAPTPTGKLNDTMGMVPGREPIRKTVAPAVSAANEPRPPGRIEKEPVPTPKAATPTPGTALANQRATAGQGMSEGWGTGTPHPVVAKPKKSPVPHASPTARRHANRHARFNRTITDPTLKAWAEGAKAAALEARTKYETANPRPAHKSTT